MPALSPGRLRPDTVAATSPRRRGRDDSALPRRGLDRGGFRRDTSRRGRHRGIPAAECQHGPGSPGAAGVPGRMHRDSKTPQDAPARWPPAARFLPRFRSEGDGRPGVRRALARAPRRPSGTLHSGTRHGLPTSASPRLPPVCLRTARDRDAPGFVSGEASRGSAGPPPGAPIAKLRQCLRQERTSALYCETCARSAGRPS